MKKEMEATWSKVSSVQRMVKLVTVKAQENLLRVVGLVRANIFVKELQFASRGIFNKRGH